VQGILISGELYKKHSTDAGWDIFSAENNCIPAKGSATISTGLRVLVPAGCVGLVKARSGLSFKHHIEIGAGVIDEGYTGEIKVKMYNMGTEPFKVYAGDRIAQLITVLIYNGDYKQEEVSGNTERGDSGFGSTGGSNEQKHK
jgi:dUTP pyrophosphatase